MTGDAGEERPGDDEAHVAALLAVLALARDDGAPGREPCGSGVTAGLPP